MQVHTCVRDLVVSAHAAGRIVIGAAVRFWEVYNGDVNGQGPRIFEERLSLLLQGHQHVFLSGDRQDFNLRLDRASVAGICRRSGRPSNFAGCSDTQTVTELPTTCQTGERPFPRWSPLILRPCYHPRRSWHHPPPARHPDADSDDMPGIIDFCISTKDRTFVDEVHYKGRTIRLGDWLHLSDPNDPSHPIVRHVFKCWILDEA